MTATSACLVELEALRERLTGIIRELKHAERMVDAFDLDAATPTPPVASTTLIVKPTARAVARPAPERAIPPRAQQPNDVKVIAAMDRLGQDQGDGWATVDVIARAAKLVKGTVYGRLTRLMAAGRIEQRMEGKHALYRRRAHHGTSTQLRPGAVAGTPAAPPVGPPSANGSKSAPQCGDFDVAWNGTKERNGEAPSILGPRERKP